MTMPVDKRSVVGIIPTGFDSADLQLPYWRVAEGLRGAGLAAWTAGVLVSFSFTIFNYESGAVVGLANRDGMNANGITFTDADYVSHLVGGVDNELTDPAVPELRQVEYSAEAASGAVYYHTVLYYLLPRGG